MKKIGLALAMLSVFGLIGIAKAVPVGGSVTGTADITGLSCTIDVNSAGDPGYVAFGSVYANGVTKISPDTVYLTDTGNINAALSISGSDWTTYGSSVGWTSYSETWQNFDLSSGSASGTLSYSPGTSIGAIAPAGDSSVLNPSDPTPATTSWINLNFGLTVPAGQPSGSPTQTITVVGTC